MYKYMNHNFSAPKKFYVIKNHGLYLYIYDNNFALKSFYVTLIYYNIMPITQIIVDIKTGNAAGADADGPVYLGVGSREFRLDKPGNQFERNKLDQFVLGNGGPGGAANVKNPNENDPLQPIAIEGHDVLGSPFGSGGVPTILPTPPYNVYIRYESNTKWLVETVSVKLIGALASFPIFNVTLGVKNGINPPGIWLGSASGKFLYLQP